MPLCSANHGTVYIPNTTFNHKFFMKLLEQLIIQTLSYNAENYSKPEFRGERCRACPPLHSHPHKKVMIISGQRNKCGNFIESTWIFSFLHKNIYKLSQIRKKYMPKNEMFPMQKQITILNRTDKMLKQNSLKNDYL